MKKYLTSTLIAILFIAIMCLAPDVKAATTGNVSTTVTVTNVSITVGDGSVAYGTITMGATADTTTAAAPDDSQTVNNNGNVTADLNIMGADTTNWTLSATAGSEQYTHKFCTSDCDGSPTWTALTTSYQTLSTGLLASNDQIFDLQIGTPTTTTNFDEQSASVTVQAVDGS